MGGMGGGLGYINLVMWLPNKNGGGSKTINQTKLGFNPKDPGQAEKQLKISKYKAKLIK